MTFYYTGFKVTYDVKRPFCQRWRGERAGQVFEARSRTTVERWIDNFYEELVA